VIEQQSFISVRLVTVDHYQANPIPDLDPTYAHSRNYNIKKVPVLRIFGSSVAGIFERV
jgi:DNA polymerase zeta